MKKEEEKEFLPTQPARPYRGQPRTMHDILMAQIQREDKGVEGMVRVVRPYDPAIMQRIIELNKVKTPVKRNWAMTHLHPYAL